MALKIPAFKKIQNKILMPVFISTVKIIYERFEVSRIIDNKKLGYQISFSPPRIKEIKNYLL
jgi:hypothetical protein